MHGNEYQLAERMKSRFSGRGSAVSGMRASSTSELVRRAQMGGDPSVNCSELSFGNGTGRQNAGQHRAYYANSAGMGRSNTSAAGQSGNDRRGRTDYGRSGTTQRSQSGVGTQQNRNRVTGQPRSGRETLSDDERPRPERTRERTQSKSNMQQSTQKKQNTQKNRTSNTKKNAKRRNNGIGAGVRSAYAAGVGEISEVKVEGRRITPMFVVFLIIGTLMIMSIVFSFSEIYRTTGEISSLENTLSELEDRAAELELKLEEKNDIRIIEQMATEELGMVNQDSVQRKYISLSDGERIDVIENESANEDKAASGVLLSSFWSSLGSLFDYFR